MCVVWLKAKRFKRNVTQRPVIALSVARWRPATRRRHVAHCSRPAPPRCPRRRGTGWPCPPLQGEPADSLPSAAGSWLSRFFTHQSKVVALVILTSTSLTRQRNFCVSVTQCIYIYFNLQGIFKKFESETGDRARQACFQREIR